MGSPPARPRPPGPYGVFDNGGFRRGREEHGYISAQVAALERAVVLAGGILSAVVVFRPGGTSLESVIYGAIFTLGRF